jgi:hypothetical protein
MKLTTVLSSVNNNPDYYLFIPKQILFWNKFNIKFIAIFAGDSLPSELQDYSNNIILWSRNTNLHPAFVAQNLRIYYPALINLPDDEVVMITDMDMLPMNDTFYKQDLDLFTKNDFIYYRHIDSGQIYMCYNAAHPNTWSKIFNITSEDDIENAINSTFQNSYNGIPGSSGWYTDQIIMYSRLIKYPNLVVLNRPLKRLEMSIYADHLRNNHTLFINNYDDAHFHRNYNDNLHFITDAERQLFSI